MVGRLQKYTSINPTLNFAKHLCCYRCKSEYLREKTAGNTCLAKAGHQCLFEHLCYLLSFVFNLNICTIYPSLRQAPYVSGNAKNRIADRQSRNI